MVQAPKGYLRKPQKNGFVSPLAANSVIAAAHTRWDAETVAALLVEAELFRAPGEDEPLREEKAARLHAAVFRRHPDQAQGVMTDAGIASADAMMATQLSRRARTLLRSAPWTVSAWLLGRWASQHAWMFAGSGRFQVRDDMEFEIVGNPVVKAVEGQDVPISLWQQTVFERWFQELVDPRLICREMECEANGAASCQFAFMLRDPAADVAAAR